MTQRSSSMPPPPGIRAAALARPFLSELGLVALPSSLTLPAVQSCGLAEDGELDNERVSGNADKCCRSVRWCGAFITFHMQGAPVVHRGVEGHEGQIRRLSKLTIITLIIYILCSPIHVYM